jgi:hypothetical protein
MSGADLSVIEYDKRDVIIHNKAHGKEGQQIGLSWAYQPRYPLVDSPKEP